MAGKKTVRKGRAGKGKKAAHAGKSRAQAAALAALIDATGLSLNDIRTELMLLAKAPVRRSKKKGRKKARSS